MASSTARLAISSTLRSEASVSLVGLSEIDVTSVPWGTVTATVRYSPSGSPVLPRITASGSGTEGPGVAPDLDVPVDVGHLLDRDVLGEDGRRIGMGGRPRGAAQGHVPAAVEQGEVHVGRKPAGTGSSW